MYQQPSTSGIKYQGRNEVFWEHQSKAQIVWGYSAQRWSVEKIFDGEFILLIISH